MTDEERKAMLAFAERETPRMTQLRREFTHHVEQWIRALPQEIQTIEAVGKLLGDVSALYCLQVGMDREAFIKWMTDAYDCYGYIVAYCRVGGEVHATRAHEIAESFRKP